ncbi:acylase [Azomonas macrocytogenes]|uniref:Acyl-homoserine-lactone acylase n=1 Tax=Azomonas macrocytogenes TaxID=69962 RepID=A0A839T4V2_AZOMA|nr:acylase [Azomonas macrocytogenes]MBB3104561.1 acyl-homoserine-lactone acylase [Azomonas macrocytogenes]
MRISQFFRGLALCCLAVPLWASQLSADSPFKAEISWSSLGIPHIEAQNDFGLGYGIGYVYARDNLCLLADEVVTVNGERSRYFGRKGESSAKQNNIESDLFFRWLNSPERIQTFWASQTLAMQQRLSGYVAGFNRYLAETPSEVLPTACRQADWLRSLKESDLVSLTRRLLVEGGIGRFVNPLLAASPPSESATNTTALLRTDAMLSSINRFALDRGSNAIAVGGTLTENKKGRLLANPHFPWSGGMRFYELHLSIPGRLDVMGAALPGLPVVNIGFNQHMAWTHTVDKSSHFTLHRLALDPQNRNQYLIDGESHPFQKTEVSIQVKEPNGMLSTVSHTFYESLFGPLLTIPGLLDWDDQQTFALQDANLSNTRVLQQWDEINQATDINSLRTAISHVQGIPWVNTLAVDDKGNAIYMNASVVPHIPPERLQTCVLPSVIATGLPGLDGSKTACAWQADSGAAQRGIVAARNLPVLVRHDFLQNSNDSAWLTNPHQPLAGFSPLISQESKPLGMRARFALSEILARNGQPLSEEFLQRLVTNERVYLADLILDDLLDFCGSQTGNLRISSACSAMAAWDRRAGLESSLGLLFFQAFANEFLEGDGLWRFPFDPAKPLNTPRGIAWQQAEVGQKIEQILANAARKVATMGLTNQAKWGQVQFIHRGEQKISIPGGDGRLGIYNAIQSESGMEHNMEVISGSSYIQLVSFDNQGPVAKGLLTFSQSSDPDSPHFKDQTELFSKQDWQPLPFTKNQIQADKEVEKLQLK